MVKKSFAITADDLIIEYMVEKMKNGQEPNFSISEFMDFLHFFKNQMKVEDKLDNGKLMIKRFLDRETQSKWNQKDDITGGKIATPHFDFIESEEMVKANYRFRDCDTHLLTCYVEEPEIEKIRKIIKEYLAQLPKRMIAISDSLSADDLLVGNLIAANMIRYIWSDYVDRLGRIQKWPSQCRDIYRYLLNMDLAPMIELPSIKEQTIEFYNIVSGRIATLYQNDKNLQLRNIRHKSLLSYSNFLGVIKGYKNYAPSLSPAGKRELEIDLKDSTFKETHKVNHGCYAEDKTTTLSIQNEDAKKLVYTLNEIQK